jgi:hypothetical protein
VTAAEIKFSFPQPSMCKERAMTLRSISLRSVILVGSVLAAPSASAECITGGRWWIDDKLVELVFSGTVVEITRTAELGYRATLEVDRVWKGSVPPRFDLYLWELAPEMPRVGVGRRYVLGAKRLLSVREREGVGLATNHLVAFAPINCGALEYKDAEQSGTIRDLGVGRRPSR